MGPGQGKRVRSPRCPATVSDDERRGMTHWMMSDISGKGRHHDAASRIRARHVASQETCPSHSFTSLLGQGLAIPGLSHSELRGIFLARTSPEGQTPALKPAIGEGMSRVRTGLLAAIAA